MHPISSALLSWYDRCARTLPWRGIHDAYRWRTKYGGDIYQWNGSHGCVNAPLEVAQTLYERVEMGTPVIVYESSRKR